ncbi:flagellar biosynthesis protein [Pseudomonas yamanorum]|uniref:Flagellar biosynthesis protein n=1 Tax=Pseudomonas yamanorum TaxID=515393 RepID=A0A7Y8EIU9_9PSED|nr:flagellar biosynthesis protein [Pseudomonas yamanorum]NVZ84330.1 flagellar biosynthesis protein [Pseudomonas yamanorum]NWE15357.1 flagellar biosynthesis protein [Pseudomonas yamanorum]
MSVRIALGMVALMVLAGCATSRSEVDVNVAPLSAAHVAAASNGKKVLISAVDERVFQIDPPEADIPSLKNDEVTDKAITERAIARKRNTYGKGLGDVLLPSGRTVSQLVSESVALAYKQAGYEVVTEANATGAEPVKVHIVEFWSWFTPGFFSVDVNNKSHLRIETSAPNTLEVITRKKESMQAVTESDWKKITEAGLQEVSQATFKKL